MQFVHFPNRSARSINSTASALTESPRCSTTLTAKTPAMLVQHLRGDFYHRMGPPRWHSVALYVYIYIHIIMYIYITIYICDTIYLPSFVELVNTGFGNTLIILSMVYHRVFTTWPFLLLRFEWFFWRIYRDFSSSHHCAERSGGIGKGYTGGYHEYFGPDADIDSHIYLMLSNDLIHSIAAWPFRKLWRS